MKPVITESHEKILAYLSAWAPLGTEFIISIQQVADDTGYKDRRTVYYAIQRLREVGAVTLINNGKHWRSTTLVCHKREEEFRVIVRAAGGRARRKKDHKAEAYEPLPVAPPVVPVPSPRKLIAYVGKECAA